jgi:hypothetical protein
MWQMRGEKRFLLNDKKAKDEITGKNTEGVLKSPPKISIINNPLSTTKK